MRNVCYEIEGKFHYPRWNKHAQIPVVNNAKHQIYRQVWIQVSEQLSIQMKVPLKFKV